MPVRRTTALLAVAAGLGLAAPAPAVVPPRDCGSLTVKGKRYNVKADQLRCADAKAWTRTYLERRRAPRGYRCRRYTDTKLTFRCHRGVRTFFAIRR
ncbi:MAG TPA: hypothetical protein VD931_07190 [Baekduia sp.]|nr:hypothetical protein [Baekduia sp.]